MEQVNYLIANLRLGRGDQQSAEAGAIAFPKNKTVVEFG